MDDLISRNALKEWLTRPTGFRANCEDCTDIDCLDCIIGEAIDNAPAVDAVEVVRCKDCKWYLPGTAFPDEMFCMRAVAKFAPDDYCSYGERRNDDATD